MKDRDERCLTETARERLRRIRSGEDKLLTEEEFWQRAAEVMRKRGDPKQGLGAGSREG